MTELKGRLGRLVRVTTSTEAELTGFYAPADQPDAPTLIYFHGLSGDFDTNFIFHMLAQTEAANLNILSTKSSGHGNIATTRRGTPPVYKLTGSAFETFADCVHDIESWVDLAARHSAGPIVLMGHSLGASKVPHYMARARDERVKAVVLCSPSDNPGGYEASVGSERFKGFLKLARESVAAGDPRKLMPDDCTIGLLKQRVAAGTFLDRFEKGKPADAYDFFDRGSEQAFKDFETIAVPVFILYADAGELVGEIGSEGAIELLRERSRAPSLDSLIVSGGHWYFGSEDKAMGTILRWALKAIGSNV
jgi:pimeloyl-ACP methyl ester carboxylesterase